MNSQQPADGSTDGDRHRDGSLAEARAAGRPNAERTRWLQDRLDRLRSSYGSVDTGSLPRAEETSSRAANHVAAALAKVQDLITKPRG
jgi:hypothetical protein